MSSTQIFFTEVFQHFDMYQSPSRDARQSVIDPTRIGLAGRQLFARALNAETQHEIILDWGPIENVAPAAVIRRRKIHSLAVSS